MFAFMKKTVSLNRAIYLRPIAQMYLVQVIVGLHSQLAQEYVIVVMQTHIHTILSLCLVTGIMSINCLISFVL